MQLTFGYARVGRDRIAYQTVGAGPLVLVNAPGSFSHADVVFEDPAAVLYYRRLASFARVIHFDRRGTGGSDPAPSDGRPPEELYAEELTAVLDATGVEQTAILAMLDVGPMAIWFAATNPHRTSALILANTSARHLAADDYPIGLPNRGRRPLKQRARGEVRLVPCPPALLHAHIEEFGVQPDGRVWRRARQAAFTTEAAASPLARTPYDLRHAAVSTWLIGGVPPTTVAEWVGHSVEALLRIYAKCLDGGDALVRRRVRRPSGTPTPPRTSPSRMYVPDFWLHGGPPCG